MSREREAVLEAALVKIRDHRERGVGWDGMACAEIARAALSSAVEGGEGDAGHLIREAMRALPGTVEGEALHQVRMLLNDALVGWLRYGPPPAPSAQARCEACAGYGGQEYRESLIGPCQSCLGTGFAPPASEEDVCGDCGSTAHEYVQVDDSWFVRCLGEGCRVMEPCDPPAGGEERGP